MVAQPTFGPSGVTSFILSFFSSSYVCDTAFAIVTTPLFGTLIFAVIFINAIALATQHNNSSNEEIRAINVINIVCTVIFACEMLLKIVAFGVSGYVADSFNLFDGAVVILSVVDDTASLVSTGISVFRLARVLRVFRMTRTWQSMRTIVEVSYLHHGLKLLGNLIILSACRLSLQNYLIFVGRPCY